MKQENAVTFGDLGVSVDLLKILESQNIIYPTPIQERCIAFGLEGKDILGIAQTGTGKTLAFGLPAIEQVRKKKGKCVIMLPTRELAIQVNEVLSNLGRPFGIRTALLIGGVSSFPQKKSLQRNPDIIIATPGRMIDHLHRNNCDVTRVSLVVLDEADRMLDIGFMPQIRAILSLMPQKKQTMLFSATMPNEIASLTKEYMTEPKKIQVAPSGTSAQNIKQEAYIVSQNRKQSYLEKILKENEGSVLVFTRTKFKAKKVALTLRDNRFSAIEMHSNRSLAQRKKALDGFKSGQYRILVATDVAARGIDVNDISLVVNFDLPESAEDYVHRIGRTGRAGKSGKAMAFVEPDQKYKLTAIENLIKKPIKLVKSGEEFSNLRSNNKSQNSFSSKRRTGRPQWKKSNYSSSRSSGYGGYGRQAKASSGQRKKW